MSELYQEASSLLEKLLNRKGGLKSLAYSDSINHKRSSFALVCQTLRYKTILDQIITQSKLEREQKKLLKSKQSKALLYISLYDLLFGRQKIQGGGYMKKLLMKYHHELHGILVRMKIKQKVKRNIDLLSEENRLDVQLPRYIRVNTIKTTTDSVFTQLDKDFPKLLQRDPHIDDLLVLPPGTELHEHQLVKDGSIILQDKASCFPAFILAGEREYVTGGHGDVIDACAAPGNKTSHLAMILNTLSQGTNIMNNVFAFDRSKPRLNLLRKRMESAGASSIVEPCLQSFLDVDPNDPKYKNVRSILLDPSCSGSGMSNRLDHLLDLAKLSSSSESLSLQNDCVEYEDVIEDTDPEKERLKSLSDFQLEALLKAFSFPQVERVSYSTCSIFCEENENVVASALEKMGSEFELKKCLPSWGRRGDSHTGLSAEQSDCLVRALSTEDMTNGFFVAYFERKKKKNSKEMKRRLDTESEVILSSKTDAQRERKKRKRMMQKIKKREKQ